MGDKRSGENAAQVLRQTTDAVAQAANGNFILGSVRFPGVITSVKFIPVTGITGANTDTRLLRLYNRGTNGAGTTLAASYQFDSGNNSTSKVPKALTLSGTAANLNVSAGDVLEANSQAVGLGIADGGGVWEIEITRT